MKLSDMLTFGYKGMGASIIESLYEYGFVYSYDDPRSEGDLRIIYKIDEHKFDWSDFDKDLDIHKEFDWIKDTDWDSINKSIDAENCVAIETLPLWHQIHILIDIYGYENVCGTAYYTFDIVEE